MLKLERATAQALFTLHGMNRGSSVLDLTWFEFLLPVCSGRTGSKSKALIFFPPNQLLFQLFPQFSF